MNISLEQVKEVRNRSSVGMAECKSALEEAAGDVDKALEVLQKRGLLRAASRAGRIAAQGKIGTYVHGDGSKVCMVEVNCETDFAAKSPTFKEFCENVAMQIVGMSPVYVQRTDVPEAQIAKQREIFEAQLRKEGKPEQAVAKIVEGKLNKWLTEVCLLEQESVTSPKKTVDQVRAELVAQLGENVTIRRFTRWEVGEGIEKPVKEDYASEVAKLAGS